MIRYVFLLLVFTTSCSLFDKDETSIDTNVDLVSTDMASVNYRMRPKLIRKEKAKDFNELSKEIYLSKVEQYHDPSEKEYLDYLSHKSTKVLVKGKDRNFAVCTKNKTMKFILCDSATSSFIDFVSKDMTIDLDQRLTDLLSNK